MTAPHPGSSTGNPITASLEHDGTPALYRDVPPPTLRPVSRAGWLESSVLLLVRVALGLIFLYAAWMKLHDAGSVRDFANAVKAFELIPVDTAPHLVVVTTFAVPWTEAFVGAFLILGLRTRGAGLVLSGLLLMFTVAIALVMQRPGEPPECGCFGDFNQPCTGPVGWCHIGRNLGLFLFSAWIAWRGGGRLSLDALCAWRAARREARWADGVDARAEDA